MADSGSIPIESPAATEARVKELETKVGNLETRLEVMERFFADRFR